MAELKPAVAEMDDLTTADALKQLSPLMNGVKRLYRSGEYMDLEIICKDRKWRVHKFLLCAQSDFFQKACGGDFSEAKNGKIVLDDEDPQVIDDFLYYLYNFKYSDTIPTGFSPIVRDLRMYVIADKYFVEPLKDLAAKKFEEGATAWWSTRAFADAIAEIYQTTASGEANPLKETAIRTATTHAHDLLDKSKGYDYFLDMMAETAEFGKDLSIALGTTAGANSDSSADTNTYRCRERGHIFKIPSVIEIFRCPYCDNLHNVTEEKSWSGNEMSERSFGSVEKLTYGNYVL